MVIPDGGPNDLEQIAVGYGVGWVVLETNHPAGLDELYANPSLVPWLDLVATTQSAFGDPIYTFRVVERADLP